VAHELHAFNSNPNSQKYHASLTRQPPDLARVDFASLSSLCQQYSQPAPEQHPEHGERATAAMMTTAPQAAADSRTDLCQDATGLGQTVSAVDDATNHAVQQQAGHNVAEGDCGVATVDRVEELHRSGAAVLDAEASTHAGPAAGDAHADPSQSSGRAASEPHADGSADPHGSGSRRPESESHVRVDRNLKRLRDACEEGEGAPRSVKAFVDALFDDDEESPNADGVVVVAPEEEYVPDSSGYEAVGYAAVNKLCTQARVCADAVNGGARSGTTGAVKPASGLANVWTEVREFVAMCLEPWVVSGAVNEEQSEVILDKCVSKVLSAHAGRKDAHFLEAEGEKIQGLVAQYADFIVKKKSRNKSNVQNDIV
jgi:hypothetical protein